MSAISMTRRHVLIGAGTLAGGAAAAQVVAPPAPGDLRRHEGPMRQAIAEARKNPRWPFGAVIVDSQGRTVATGVNGAHANPMFHGEVVAMNDYVAREGNRGWGKATLYTTGEPCPMCMGAIIWAGIGTVVYGTSIATLSRVMKQIEIKAETVAAAASFYRGSIVGGVLEHECDALFRSRPGSD